ncbi:MAG: tautomerase family protein [Opitutales bacterium]|nr:tautomerase family protein [Opitutales bacterium]
MAQIIIYSLRENLAGRKARISDTLHMCVTESLGLPTDKRFHRFIAMEEEDFIHPEDRSTGYTIIEVSMFAGRSKETKKKLIRSIFRRFNEELGITPQDVEITIHETPQENWGIRGMPGDELSLSYKVEK